METTHVVSTYLETEMFLTYLDHFTGLTFFHPDYTVGPGIPPDPTLTRLRAITADRELQGFRTFSSETRSPCPEGCLFTCKQIIRVCKPQVNRFSFF
jgi:hypothetical protein